MASTKTGRNALPARFRPLFDQSATETQIRYGSQEDALSQILGMAQRDYGRQSQAQNTAGQSVLGALQHAGPALTAAYSDAGLTPGLLAQIANSPTGQRLAGELASGQSAIVQQTAGAQAGNQFAQQHLFDQYRDQVGQIGGQITSLGKEKGLYQSSLLDQLITGDRKTRHDANVAATKQQHDDQQSILDRATSTGNALIGQGVTPVINSDGSVTLGPAIPGGKADPKAQKRTTGAGTASPDAQRSVGTAFSKALALAGGLTRGQPKTPEVSQGVAGILTNGKSASSGKPIYDEVPVLDAAGRPKVGPDGKAVTKQVKRLNADGTPATTKPRPAVPSFDEPVAQAATEQAMFGYVTTATVRKLQKLGYSVNQIPGLKTEGQAKASRPKDTRDYARPGTAQSRDQQPG